MLGDLHERFANGGICLVLAAIGEDVENQGHEASLATAYDGVIHNPEEENIVARKILLWLFLGALLLGGTVVFLILRNNALLLEYFGDTPTVSTAGQPSKGEAAAKSATTAASKNAPNAPNTPNPQTALNAPNPAGPAVTAGAWIKVSTNATSSIYLDSTVSKRVGSNIMIWLLRDYNGPQYDGSVNYLSSKDQIEVDCGARRVRRVYSSNHPQSMGGGAFVSSEHGPMSWNEVTWDSVIRRAVDIACMNSKS